jgi:serine/threonine protein phosphatase PrpC
MATHSVQTFDTAGATHIGMVRQRNEDNFLLKPGIGIWAVADGMGGHSRGDLASKIIVDSLESIEKPASAADLLSACEYQVTQANSRIREIARRSGNEVIGATLAVLLVYKADYACVWAGDSRVYLIHAGDILQVSRDHTEVAEMVAKGVLSETQAKQWPHRNVVTRAIGARDDPELEISSGIIDCGDAFVLCSDGLTAHVSDREIFECVTRYQAQDACDRLIQLTLERGAVDNVTVVVVRYCPDGRTASSFAQASDFGRE